MALELGLLPRALSPLVPKLRWRYWEEETGKSHGRSEELGWELCIQTCCPMGSAQLSVSLHLKICLCAGASCRRVSHSQGFVPPPHSPPLDLVRLCVTDKRKRKTGRGEATQTVKTVKESSSSLGSSGMGMRAYIFQREAPREK